MTGTLRADARPRPSRTGRGAAFAALLAVSVVVAVGCEAMPNTEESSGVEPGTPTREQAERLETASEAKSAGDYGRALGLFQEILAENPTITVAYLGIGDIYIVKQEYAKAEPAYGRAARLEPRNFDAQYGHGLALQLLKRFVDAVRAYHRALVIDPDSAKANLNVALTYLQLNDPDRAVRFAERSVQLEPSSGPAHATLGSIYEKLERYPEAVDAYIAALELMGNQPPLMMNLINVQAKVERYHEAANTAEALVRIAPSAEAYERLGWCFFKLREYDRSMAAYRSAVEEDAVHWPALNGIGVNALNTWIVSKKRDVTAKREAGEAFRRSLRANADQPKVVQLLLNYSL